MFRILFFLMALLATSCSPRTPEVDQPTAVRQDIPAILERPTEAGQYEEARLDMVAKQIAVRGVENQRVLDALSVVPRHLFVPDVYLDQAYADHPLPIGFGQTISQPYIVGLMSEALNPQEGQKVLEIGTGSGYQAAILAELGMDVYSVEIIPELADLAVQNLAAAGYTEVNVLNADGYFGWEEYAPFDAIIVTAAPDHLPQPLAEQLAEGGRMIVPIGPVGAVQSLWFFKKVEGELEALNLGPVRFVPFTREE